MAPFICTSNTQGHVDYGIPIIATKSDYRTSTGTYHRFIPSMPQHYDRKIKRSVKPELKTVTDITIYEDRKSDYKNSFVPLTKYPLKTNIDRAPDLLKISYIRNAQEKMLKNPPPPIQPKLSEMKDSYRMKYYRPRHREMPAPSSEAKCDIEGLGRPLQPGIPPGQCGHWKYLDIYMTENKLKYPLYSKDQMEKAKEDIPTYYSATGQYKELKEPLPGPLTGNTSIYDKTVFKKQLPLRSISRAPKNVPNMKFKTEYMGSYRSQTYSDLYPYLQANGVPYEESLADAGPWQNLSGPGMYCTEYCHIGTGWPVRAIVNTGLQDMIVPHNNTSTKTQT